VGWMPVSDGRYGTEIEWDSPDAGVGWVVSSALPGDDANAVLYGHNNLNASVFKKLGELEPGDQIRLATGERDWFYQVDSVTILAVADDSGMQAAYEDNFAPGDRARLTLVSCWPPTSNTHRIIVVAYPIQSSVP
ncbi:MAG TPA: class E sortase, partial [Anaerolineaceae bacterium]|nr:class E sortase [Anaerolineaceae bacterium]